MVANLADPAAHNPEETTVSDSVPQMRERIDQQNEQLKAREQELQELKSQLRTANARELFREQGLSPKHAELFAATNPEGELTPESVQEFATSYGLAPQAAEPSEAGDTPEPQTTEDDPGEGLSAFSGAGSRGQAGDAATPRTTKMTRDEWKALRDRDPAAAKVAIANGQVELNPNNFYVRTGQTP